MPGSGVPILARANAPSPKSDVVQRSGPEMYDCGAMKA